MPHCTRCILPDSFPGVSFNAEGACNFCRAHKPETVGAEAKGRYEEKFLALAREHRNPDGYDVLLAYSGGKDSTYTLDVFVSRYRFRVLALTFDNGFVSERSFLNMRKVTEALRADHLIVRPDPVLLKTIFRGAAERELYPRKAMERASTICTSCIGLVKAVMLRSALEKGIPFIGFGWSPGQAPLQASVLRTNPALLRLTQKAILDPLSTVVGRDALAPYFVTEEQFSRPEAFPWNVHPLAFLPYDEGEVRARIRELGWEPPDDTDANSTNCTLNAYANAVHLERYGFHPYVWEIANMVRCGVMSRDEGMEKFVRGENPELVRYARERLEG